MIPITKKIEQLETMYDKIEGMADGIETIKNKVEALQEQYNSVIKTILPAQNQPTLEEQARAALDVLNSIKNQAETVISSNN